MTGIWKSVQRVAAGVRLPPSRVCVVSIIALGILTVFLWPLPKGLLSSAQSLRITDREGRLLYDSRMGSEGLKRDINENDIPPIALNALVAIEDRTFFSHFGISMRGILRSAIQNLAEGRIVSGGSTITQQLVRISVQPAHRSLLYKVYEAITALKVEQAMDKQTILTRYLSTVYFGHQAYGLPAAAQTYFGKSPQELSTAEIAMLIGLIQSPSRFDPFTHMPRAKVRQQAVLDAMRETGIIDDRNEEQSSSEPLKLAEDTIRMEAPHFVQWILQRRAENATNGTIHTTLDLPLQRQLEAIVTHQLEDLKDKNVTSAAVIVLDAKNGDILAMVGSHDYYDRAHDGSVNRAIALRQPGSTLKPFTYALALENGDSAATTVEDIETQFFTQQGNPYIPRNYDYGYHGLVRYREALANSYNIAAVKVLEKVGVSRLLTFLRDDGFSGLTKTAEDYGLALTLGDGEVRLLELAQGYGIFPRFGRTLHIRSLLTDPIETGKQLIRSDTAWLISDILSDPSARMPEFGEAQALTFPFPVAAKTGTTRNSRDNWTVGYTTDRIVAVWVGNADNTPMQGTSGITGAGPIFHDAMLAAMQMVVPSAFVKPATIHTVTICRLSGLLPTSFCPQTIEESFVAGTEPKTQDTIYQMKRIDIRNGLLAGSACNAEFIRSMPVTVFPPELRTWARENGWQTAPEQYSPLCEGNIDHSDSLVITSPHDGDSFLLDPLVPDDRELSALTAHAPTGTRWLDWYADGKLIGRGYPPTFNLFWHPVRGLHEIRAQSLAQSTSIHVSVETSVETHSNR